MTSRILISSVFSVFVFLIGSETMVRAENVTFDFQASHGAVSAPANRFGVTDGAQVGLDPFDLPQPPPDPVGSFNTFLSMTNPPEVFPNRWLRDIRSVESLVVDKVELWPATIEGVTVGETVGLLIQPALPPDLPYLLFLSGPGLPFQEVAVPGYLEIPIVEAPQTLIWELHLDSGVNVEKTTWGGVKSLYH